MYFITLIKPFDRISAAEYNRHELGDGRFEKRLLGYFQTLKSASNTVHNMTDSFNMRYIVIEALPEGIFIQPTGSWWYEWNNECWTGTAKPACLANYNSFVLE